MLSISDSTNNIFLILKGKLCPQYLKSFIDESLDYRVLERTSNDFLITYIGNDVFSFLQLITQRVRSTSATLIDNIFIYNPDQVVVSGNIISDVSDHFRSSVFWNALLDKRTCDVDNLFSSFYNKFNKLINKHAPMKTISNPKAKQLSKLYEDDAHFKRSILKSPMITICFPEDASFSIVSSD